MKDKMFRAKFETAEFLAADSLLIIGGVLVGVDLASFSVTALIGLMLVALGLFFGIRVFWKFLSDFKDIKTQIEAAVEKSRQINEEVKTNHTLLDSASASLADTQKDLVFAKQDVQNAKQELGKTLLKMRANEEKLFGPTRGVLSKSSIVNPLDNRVNELEQKIAKIEGKVDSLQRGYRV